MVGVARPIGPNIVKELLEKAAAGDAGSQYELAFQYLSGRAGEPRFSAALEWLRRAADAGHAPARERLPAIEALLTGLHDALLQTQLRMAGSGRHLH